MSRLPTSAANEDVVEMAPLPDPESDPEPLDVPFPEAAPAASVPLILLASCWKAAKLLGPDSTALIEKTMPDWQWLTWPQ